MTRSELDLGIIIIIIMKQETLHDYIVYTTVDLDQIVSMACSVLVINI